MATETAEGHRSLLGGLPLAFEVTIQEEARSSNGF